MAKFYHRTTITRFFPTLEEAQTWFEETTGHLQDEGFTVILGDPEEPWYLEPVIQVEEGMFEAFIEAEKDEDGDTPDN